MKIISFAWTTDALLAGAKTCTRREWTNHYAQSYVDEFVQSLKAGTPMLVQAWDKSPRAGGKRIGTIRLTQEPYQEWVADAPLADFEAEGLQWMNDWAGDRRYVQRMTPQAFWIAWKARNPLVWVIRFARVVPDLV